MVSENPARTRAGARSRPDVAGQDVDARCWRCNRLLAELLTRPWRIKCSRCKAPNQSGETAGSAG